jgi:branched-chain amino acid transport system substrate-binding protein
MRSLASSRHATANDAALRKEVMTPQFSRRKVLAGTTVLAAAAAFPMPSIAQSAPMKIGLMTVKTGPLAAGGIHLEQGITTFLREKDFKLAGRKVDLVVADTGGSPLGAKSKAVELVERDKVDLIMGPLAAFELLAIVNYLAEQKVPALGFAGAEDVTQRHGNPFFVRTSDSSAQCLYPLADYAIKEMKVGRAVTMADDFAFGYEQIGGFQKVFEDKGGRVVKKLWSPLNTPDYTPYIAQIEDCDVICMGLVGSNPLKFTKQARGYGIKQPLIGGSTVADDTIVSNFGDEAIGMINSIPYTFDLDTEANKRFIASIRKYFGANVPIGFYAACLYVNGQIVEAALEKTGGKSDDSAQFIKAIKSVSLVSTPRGPVSFDDHGNIVFDCYIRRIDKVNGKLVNKTIKTYPKVGQFWTYDAKTFLQEPVFSRDFPPMRN